MSKKENAIGIDYENAWLNEDQERVIERLTQSLEARGFKHLGDFKGDQGGDFKNAGEFFAYWRSVFPNLKNRVEVKPEFYNSPYWGSLEGVSVLLAGVKKLQSLGFDAKLIKDFEVKVLAHEATQVGVGNQRFVAEKDEADQK